MNVATIGFAVVAVVASAAVLWIRQSEDDLLGAESIAEALATVLFRALPGLVLFVALARSPSAVVVEGTLKPSWSISGGLQREIRIPTSLGPGILGWALIPVIVVTGRVVPVLWEGWRTGSRETRRFLAIAFVASVLGTFVLGPFAWLLGGVVAALRVRHLHPGDERHRHET